MIGEFMKTKLSIAALVAGGMMVATTGTASAADLGGGLLCRFRRACCDT